MSAAATTSHDEPAILTVRDLTTAFRRDSKSVTVVDDVGLTLERGAVLGIVGESGSGKSMLLRSIMRIVSSE